MTKPIETVRHTADPLISIYRGNEHIGFVFPPIAGFSTKFEASRNDLQKAEFDSEEEAIAFVAA